MPPPPMLKSYSDSPKFAAVIVVLPASVPSK